MMDFDDLDDAEEVRDEEEAPLRAAAEAEAVRAETANHWTAQVVQESGDGSGLVALYADSAEDSATIGHRRVGDTLRLVRRDGEFALLHPLELARIATDYQDYWNSVLSHEVPRADREAWIPIRNVSAVTTGRPAVRLPESASLGSISAASVNEHLTIIISTSAVRHHCNAEVMLQVLRSLQANEALKECRKLLVFDALPSQKEMQSAKEAGALAEGGVAWVPQIDSELAEEYKRYQDRMKLSAKMGHKSMYKVELLFLPEWGHLVGTIRYALQHVSTSYVQLHQHDLLLAETFTVGHAVGILQVLAERKANYVILNRDVNFTSRSTQYFQAAPHRLDLWRAFAHEHALHLDDDKKTGLTPFVGFSDQTHFASVDWYESCVLPLVGDRKCCMEFIVYELMLLAWLHDPKCWERTYMLGGMADGPFIYDMEKNGNSWAQVDDAYSDEKVEEMYMDSDELIMQPGRPFRCLGLYAWRRQDNLPSIMENFPDPHAMENRVCFEDFQLRGTGQFRRKAGFFPNYAPRADPVG